MVRSVGVQRNVSVRFGLGRLGRGRGRNPEESRMRTEGRRADALYKTLDLEKRVKGRKKMRPYDCQEYILVRSALGSFDSILFVIRKRSRDFR